MVKKGAKIMKLSIASDHRGVEVKKELITYLKSLGCEVIDYGTNTTTSVDYPEYAFKVGKSVVDGVVDLGIVICGTGIGMSIACNKVKGVRCAKVHTTEECILTRSHNDANVIALSAKESMDLLKELVHTFITTPFSNEERHIRRITQIKEYENS